MRRTDLDAAGEDKAARPLLQRQRAVHLLQQLMIERDFAELVHQDGGARQGAHQVVEQRRLAAAQETGEQGDGSAPGHRRLQPPGGTYM